MRDNPADSRYEVLAGDEVAGVAVYTLQGTVITFTHTKVEDAYEGHGVGSALARGALDDVRARGLTVIPRCPFIKAYIERHMDELFDLVDERARGSFDT